MSYTNDRGGNMLSRGDRGFAYDALGSMTGTTRLGVTDSWDVDTQGNRYGGQKYSNAYDYNRAVTDNTNGAGLAQQVSVDNSSRSVNLNYDAWGRLVYSVENYQPLQQAWYDDALGRRVQRTTVATGTTDSYYDGANLGAEFVGAQMTATFAHSPQGRMIRRVQHTVDSSVWLQLGEFWALADAESSTIAVAGAGGTLIRRYRYDQDGATTLLNGSGGWLNPQTNPLGFEHLYRGQRFERLQYHRDDPASVPFDSEVAGLYGGGGGRWYNPSTGRTLQPDAVAEVQGRNQYADQAVVAQI